MRPAEPLDALGLSLAAGACEIYLIRHADAVPESGTVHAYEDYELHALSERGRAQAAATAAYLGSAGLTAVYASPIRRARETADAIAAAAGVDVVDDPALREVEIGELEGEMPLRERLAALATIAMREGSWTAIPGTESSATVRARMRGALDGIAARHRGERVAAVSHAGSINAYLGTIAASDHDFLFPLANASISVVRINGERRVPMSANETAHLRAVAHLRAR